MKHVKFLDLRFDIDTLKVGLEQVLGICEWHPHHNQIGLTHSLDRDAAASWHDATGSLWYAWGEDAYDANGELSKRSVVKTEADFRNFVKEFNDTVFKDVYARITSHYSVGRVRLMRIKPKSCMSWHKDAEKRLHIPIITNPGAMMVIEDTVQHLPADGSCYLTDTTLSHTAFNSGLEERIHLVASVLE